jgi:hypothetical protein
MIGLTRISSSIAIINWILFELRSLWVGWIILVPLFKIRPFAYYVGGSFEEKEYKSYFPGFLL